MLGGITVSIIVFVLFIGWLVLLFKRPADALVIVGAALIFLGAEFLSTLNNPMTWGGVFVVLISWIVRSVQHFSNQKKEAIDKDAERRQAKLVADAIAKALATHGIQPITEASSTPNPAADVAPGTRTVTPLDKYGMPQRQASSKHPESEFAETQLDKYGMPRRAVAPKPEATGTSQSPGRKGIFYISGFLIIGLLGGIAKYLFGLKEPFSIVDVVFIGASLSFVFLWYRNDTNIHKFKRSGGFGVAIVGLAILAIPYYLFRTRGIAKGFIGTTLFALVLFGQVIFSIGGAYLAGAVDNYGRSELKADRPIVAEESVIAPGGQTSAKSSYPSQSKNSRTSSAIVDAIPFRGKYIIQSNRVEAELCLSEYANYMERYYTVNLSYNTPASGGPDNTLPTLDCANKQRTGMSYRYDLPPSSLGNDRYTVRAIPINIQLAQDTECGILTLDQDGVRTAGGSTEVAGCW
ncbi:type IV pilin protein [Rhodanobacter sp. Root179]|uniref:type IV pilin protein n=1 Tax=Rhodanobacter sp. Root179 TaxID=1736482 RepID=UPI001F29FB28|nr:type IV pilin protein [Rhodanobacter sp. Root179]